MKRFWTFVLGIVIGWVILAGGIVVAAYALKPSNFNVSTGWQNKDNEKFDDMSIATILTKGIQLASSNNLTMQSVQDAYGLDILKQIGLEGEDYDALKQKTFQQITSNPADAFGGIKLAPFFSSNVGKKIASIPKPILDAWSKNEVTASALINKDFTKLLSDITLGDLATNLSKTGMAGIVAGKDLGKVYTALKANNADPVKTLCEGALVGHALNYTTTEADSVDGFSVVIEGKVLQSGTTYYKSVTINDVTTWAVAEIHCDDEEAGHVHEEKCYDIQWLTASNTKPESLMNSLANLPLSSLFDGNFKVNDATEGLYIGDVMNYTRKSDGWYDGETKVKPIMQNIADVKCETLLNTGIDIDAVLKDIKLRDVITIDETSPVILKRMKNYKILNIADDIDKVYIGDLQEYHRKPIDDLSAYTIDVLDGSIKTDGSNYVKTIDEEWYQAELTCSLAHSHTLNCYEFVWYKDNAYTNKVGGIQGLMVNMTMTTFDIGDIMTKVNDLKFTEVIKCDASVGALSLIPAETTVGNLPQAMTDAVNNSTIKQLMDAGLLTISDDNQTTLTNVFGGNAWTEWSVATFIDNVVTQLKRIPASTP